MVRGGEGWSGKMDCRLSLASDGNRRAAVDVREISLVDSEGSELQPLARAQQP